MDYRPATMSPRGIGLRLSTQTRTPVLAFGGDSKARICHLTGSEPLFSELFGDLKVPDVYRAYSACIDQIVREAGHGNGLILAHDLHPDYLSTRLARRLGVPALAVQHHHAHIVSVMAEHRVVQQVIGICCDGVGYGTDGAAWGCEILACDPAGFKRLGHLAYFPLPGGDAAARDTWRPALALVRQAFGADWRQAAHDIFRSVPSDEFDSLATLCERGIPMPMTSSLGRVFDGVSFILGLCQRNAREAQAAAALEHAAGDAIADSYPYETQATPGGIRMCLSAAVRGIVRDVRGGKAVDQIAGRFHETLARMLASTALLAAEQSGVRTVAISGGCFANKLLRRRLIDRLEARRLRVIEPREISCGDEGLSLGQAVVAAANHERIC